MQTFSGGLILSGVVAGEGRLELAEIVGEREPAVEVPPEGADAEVLRSAAPAPAPATDLSSPVLYGKYQLLEPLARGGMAEVFKAKSLGVEGFEKIVVIKRILPEFSRNPGFVEMFINEAKIAVTLSHANIVQVFDLGRTDDTYFIAMEYVAGVDLSTLLRLSRALDRTLPPELAVYVASEVAKGLDYAHRRRDNAMQPLHIVHRDVSPQNVLVSYEGEVKLTDFGIAKARSGIAQQTELSVLKGKYAYMAPEQAEGAAVSARTDLFALGTVLYETLSGRNPFAAESPYDTLARVREGAPPPLLELTPSLPKELASIVQTAMAREPKDRYENAGRLYEDLIQFLYSSGRRVGAHDLADFLHGLRDSANERAESGEASAELRAIFGRDAASIVSRGTGSVSRIPEVSESSASSVSSARPAAEKRDVTALVGLRAAEEPLDDALLESLVARFGGTLVTHTRDDDGDDRLVIALFGTARLDERETEAAGRCALRLNAAAVSAATTASQTSTLRLGLHTSRVLVDFEGNLLKDRRYQALLDNAQTLANYAVPGQVMVSREASRVMRWHFQLIPVADHWPEGVSTIARERGAAESFGKFVGRREELRHIGELFALANRGKLRVLHIAGDPGMGKTRLLLETLRRLRLGGHDIGMYLAVCPTGGEATPLSAFREMLRAILGVDELDPEEVVREKVSRLRELGVSDSVYGAVANTLGLHAMPAGEVGERPLRRAFGRIATKLAEDRLTVFAWDAAEEMDAESRALLGALLKTRGNVRMIVMLAHRPDASWEWQNDPIVHTIDVGPMTEDDVARLAGIVLAAEELPFDLLHDVLEKSHGNPLFVEEYLRAMLDADAVEVVDGRVVYRPQVAEIEIPKTLRGIVRARVGRLAPIERHALQVAAVIGHRFASELVATVMSRPRLDVNDALTSLESRGIVTRPAATEYEFTNEFVRDVLFESMTKNSRREIDRAIANALEQLYPDRTEAMAERLAHHHREGGEIERAADFYVLAADRLEAEHSLESATANLIEAVDLLASPDLVDWDRVMALYRRIGELCYRSRDLVGGAARMEAAVLVAEELGRETDIARFAAMRGRLLVNANRFEEGRVWLGRARDVARRLGNRPLLRDVELAAAEAETRNGEHLRALAHLESALSASREMGDVAAQIRCLIPLAVAHAATGETGLAKESIATARSLRHGSVDRYTECEIYKIESLVHYFAGDRLAAIESAERALELAREYGFAYECAVNAHNLGETYLRIEDFKKAFASLRYSYDISREHGFVKLQMATMRTLGFIDAAKFGSDEGRLRMIQATEYAATQGFVWDLIQGRFMLAIIDQMRGELTDARVALAEAGRLAEEHGHRHYVEAVSAAELALDAGTPILLPG